MKANINLLVDLFSKIQAGEITKTDDVHNHYFGEEIMELLPWLILYFEIEKAQISQVIPPQQEKHHHL